MKSIFSKSETLDLYGKIFKWLILYFRLDFIIFLLKTRKYFKTNKNLNFSNILGFQKLKYIEDKIFFFLKK